MPRQRRSGPNADVGRHADSGRYADGDRRQINRRSVIAGLATSGILTAAYFISEPRDGNRTVANDFRESVTDLDAGFPEDLPYVAPDGPVDVPPSRRIFYSPAADSMEQTFGELYLPATSNPSMPVIVLIHGGGWSDETSLEYMSNMARDLASFDVAVWNVEYRRVGSGGGWPTTMLDVCDAVDHLPEIDRQMAGRLNLDNVAVMGHSSGGHLALWVAGRQALPDNLPGHSPRQRVVGGVSLAGISDMLAAANRRSDSVERFLGGGPDDLRSRYHASSPVTHLPTRVPVVTIHGDDDAVVPFRQSEEYVRRARAAGDDARLERIPGGGHDMWSDIATPEWRRARRIVLGMVGVTPFDETQSPQSRSESTGTPASGNRAAGRGVTSDGS